MTEFDPSEHPHRRYNPLTRQHVICSPQRTKRPWQGSQESPDLEGRPQYDDKCYLCPGNSRAGGKKNEAFAGTYIFENDFAAVIPEELTGAESSSEGLESFFDVQEARGRCFVVVFSPRHDLTVAEMTQAEIETVLRTWITLYKDVSSQNPWIKYIQLFENKGAIQGCSNPHPHGQSWTFSYIPSIPQTILESLRDYALSDVKLPVDTPRLENGQPGLLLAYAHAEIAKAAEPESRILEKSTHFLSLVPFWAFWPYEVMILPYRRQVKSVAELTDEELTDLAAILGTTTRRLDNLFECSFAYSMGMYQAPVDREDDWSPYAHLHFSFYPPLLRSATVKKFYAGIELFAELQRDITPEQAATRLKQVDGQVHYKQKLQ